MSGLSRGWGWAFLVAMSLAMVPGEVTAQRGPPGARQGMERAELERRVRARFGEMIRQRLDLSDEQASRLGEIVESLQEERQTLVREELALRRRVEALVLEGADDDVEARELLDRMMELRRSEAELMAEETEALLEVLTPGQILQFYGMRDQLNQRVRELRGRNRPGGAPLPGGFPGR